MLWDEIINKNRNHGFKPKQIFQEHIQKAILTHFSQLQTFHHIVFQGGTALRLFYDNPRFSEDLDFVLTTQTPYDLSPATSQLSSKLETQFPFLLKVTITKQKQDAFFQRYILQTKSSIPEQNLRIHIELAAVPSYHNTVKILSYPPLQPAVRVETLQEILADKILALGNRPYLKGRDLWDIYFLTIQKNITISWDLVWRKTTDYQTTISKIQKQLQIIQNTLSQEGIELLTTELKRFLPPSIFNSYQTMFNDIITHIITLIQDSKKQGEI